MPHQHKYDQLSDEELVHSFRGSNDNQWLGHLLQRYTALLFGVALKYLKDKTQAEDAVQQVFLKALTHFPQEDILNFKGWLYVLMRNHCLQQIRDRNYTSEITTTQISAAETDKNDIRWQDHTLEQLNGAIAHLSEEQRKAITLFYLEKLSYEQIMAQTGYTFMQVKSYIQNGKRNLRAMLLKNNGKDFNERQG